jgi:TM2 domain-containing membrane protein YozV
MIMDEMQEVYPMPGKATISPKSRLVDLLLCLFLGEIGVHKFYEGKIGLGVLYIFTFGLFGIGALIDLIMIITGGAKDSDGLPITNWDTDSVVNTTPSKASQVATEESTAQALKEYKDLLDKGVITQEEYEAKKKKLLGL